MLKLGAEGEDGKRRCAILGLTDVNLQRLQEGKPVLVSVSDFFPGVPEFDGLDVAVFHATREDALKIGRAYGIDDKKILDALGEG